MFSAYAIFLVSNATFGSYVLLPKYKLPKCWKQPDSLKIPYISKLLMY